MKIRKTFVSNSSSSSYILLLTNKSTEQCTVTDILCRNPKNLMEIFWDDDYVYGNEEEIYENVKVNDLTIRDKVELLSQHLSSDGDNFKETAESRIVQPNEVVKYDLIWGDFNFVDEDTSENVKKISPSEEFLIFNGVDC